MVVYNAITKNAVAVIEGQTKPLSEKLVDDLVAILAGSAPAAIAGMYALKVSETNCPPGTLCGTYVNVQNQAGAQADAESGTEHTTNF